MELAIRLPLTLSQLTPSLASDSELAESLKSERERSDQEAQLTQQQLEELAAQLAGLQAQSERTETERAALETQIGQLGEQLLERQRRVEQLLEELKTVNLESLRMAGAEELAKVTEGETPCSSDLLI